MATSPHTQKVGVTQVGGFSVIDDSPAVDLLGPSPKRPTRRLNPNAEETIEAATVSSFGYLTKPAGRRRRVREHNDCHDKDGKFCSEGGQLPKRYASVETPRGPGRVVGFKYKNGVVTHVTVDHKHLDRPGQHFTIFNYTPDQVKKGTP